MFPVAGIWNGSIRECQDMLGWFLKLFIDHKVDVMMANVRDTAENKPSSPEQRLRDHRKMFETVVRAMEKIFEQTSKADREAIVIKSRE